MGPRLKDPVHEPGPPVKEEQHDDEQHRKDPATAADEDEVRWNSEATTVVVSHLRPNKSGLCCKSKNQNKKKPQTGTDLGVWDKSLEDRTGPVGRWLLSYLNPLLAVGARKVLDANDIGVPPDQDRADRAYASALSAWNEQSDKCRIINGQRKAAYEQKLAACGTEQQRSKVKPPKYKEPSIAWALVKAFGLTELFVGLVYYVISALLTFVPVLILSDLVTYFESGQIGYAHPWVEVVGLAVVPFTVSLLQTRHQTIYAHCAVFCRTAVSTLLYRKALKVSSAGRAVTSTGQVVNIMSNDTAQLQRFLQFVGMTITAPMQIVIALVLIYQQVGNATWVGVAFMIFLMPINTVVFSIVTKQRLKVLQYSDLRVKMMNEILNGIRIIKQCAWERPFGKEVAHLRGKELEALTKLAYTSAIGFSLILMSAPLIQPILVFLTYTSIQDKPLDASTAFTTVALFNIMRFPFAFMPMGLLQYIQSTISLRRLERYLDLPELTKYIENLHPPAVSPSSDLEGSITVEHGSFSWVDPDAKPVRPVQDTKPKKGDKKKDSGHGNDVKLGTSSHSVASSHASDAGLKVPVVTLQDISISIEPGSLTAVVGAVGSGKSSFLAALMGEMEPIGESKVYIPRADDAGPGFISYCAQTPWIVNDTLRGNIVFGRDFDEARFDSVVEACALLDDIAVLPAGEMTEIGARGINLSGGQRSRTALARALYAEESKILLLDDPLSAVDAHVGEHIFSKAIAGEIAAGKTRILVTHQVHLMSRCDSIIVLENGRIKHHGKYEDLVRQGVSFAGAIDVRRSTTTRSSAKGNDKDKVQDVELTDEAKSKLKQSGKKLVREEEREEGSVAGSAYFHYARAGGMVVAGATFVIQGIGRASEVLSGFWLALWAERALRADQEGEPFSKGTTNFYVGIYAVFGLVGVLGLTLRAIAIAIHRLRASKQLHNDLTERILRAPVAFFDITPVGRILNRFAADMDKVDLELTQSLSQGISTIFNVLGAIGGMIAATKGAFLVPMIPIGYLYYTIQKWFRLSSTELQRINSIANSPIFADFSQVLSGTSTIRAYGEEQRFFQQCQESFDTMNASYILVQMTNYWLGLRLDVLGGLMGAFIGGVAVATSSYNFISPGWLGLALTYSIEVTAYLKHGIRMIATIEAQMNSVERILFYTQKIDIEAPEQLPSDPPPTKWPESGEIEIRHASMRYRDGPLVLKDVSLRINAGEKIGICGRTGSGKSSLMVALFRLSELEKDGGAILIDGVDITAVGTSTLRLNMSIIPQDPVIFSNSVRYNLDPFEQCSDDELWEVLKQVELFDVISALQDGLYFQVAEGGENFSQGQRQLLCIARALLRKSKLLVMDEATASIDNATDATIQKMIRENFRDATVLTIAHRLNTILDSDRVLVLDDGRVAEFDAPDVLMEAEDSLFRIMVEKSRETKGKGQTE